MKFSKFLKWNSFWPLNRPSFKEHPVHKSLLTRSTYHNCTNTRMHMTNLCTSMSDLALGWLARGAFVSHAEHCPRLFFQGLIYVCVSCPDVFYTLHAGWLPTCGRKVCRKIWVLWKVCHVQSFLDCHHWKQCRIVHILSFNANQFK